MYDLLCLLLIFGYILHNVTHIAIQDPAEHLDGVGADAFVSFQAGDLSGADMVLLDEGILCDTTEFHHFPKFIIRDHNLCPLPT